MFQFNLYLFVFCNPLKSTFKKGYNEVRAKLNIIKIKVRPFGQSFLLVFT